MCLVPFHSFLFATYGRTIKTAEKGRKRRGTHAGPVRLKTPPAGGGGGGGGSADRISRKGGGGGWSSASADHRPVLSRQSREKDVHVRESARRCPKSSFGLSFFSSVWDQLVLRQAQIWNLREKREGRRDLKSCLLPS